jgi:hypothetical protein
MPNQEVKLPSRIMTEVRTAFGHKLEVETYQIKSDDQKHSESVKGYFKVLSGVGTVGLVQALLMFGSIQRAYSYCDLLNIIGVAVVFFLAGLSGAVFFVRDELQVFTNKDKLRELQKDLHRNVSAIEQVIGFKGDPQNEEQKIKKEAFSNQLEEVHKIHDKKYSALEYKSKKLKTRVSYWIKLSEVSMCLGVMVVLAYLFSLTPIGMIAMQALGVELTDCG